MNKIGKKTIQKTNIGEDIIKIILLSGLSNSMLTSEAKYL
jgi:hypothetical protein